MYRVRRNYDQWKMRWPWRLIFRPKVNERYCRHCGMPFQNGPMPESIKRFDEGNIGCLVFPAGGYRKHDVVVRFGRWRASSGRFYLSEFVPTEDLGDLLLVLERTQKELKPAPVTRARRQ